jgi:glutathione S-transferase
MIKLYDFELSGNCYKVRLMLSLLGLEHELVSIDIKSGEQKSPAYLKLNPLGKVPVLTDSDVVIRDSQAILVYLARRYGGDDWLPKSPEQMSKVVQWLSTAASEIQNGLATVRRHFLLNAPIDLESANQTAHHILQIIDEHLQERDWLECDRLTIADIACFPYIGLASDANIDLKPYPHIVAWLDRIKKLPGYISMPGL